MGNFTTRLAIVIGIVLLVHGGFYIVRAGTRPPEMQVPERSIRELPRQLGRWRGEDADLDPKIFTNSEADEAVNRIYQDRGDRKISAFVALYTDPAKGLYHSPTNCYRSNGYTMLSDVRVSLQTKDRPDIQVSLSTWELKGDRILVVYWYEVGEYTLFERLDLWTARWNFRGRQTWPPMF